MSLRPLLTAVCLSLCAGCSTTPSPVPAKIDPPPVALVSDCGRPDPLPPEVTAQSLAEWTVAWVGAWGCERAKRRALIEAWPR